MPYPHEVEEKIIYEIRKNMEAGIYKSKMKRYSKSVIWNVFSEIANKNGKILFGYIYCTKCAKIFKHSGTQYSGHIYRHGCLSAEDVDDDEIDSKDETVANSKESVQGEAMDITKEIWQTFDLALTEDGNNLDVLITCSQCNMTITKNDINLQKPHKCCEG